MKRARLAALTLVAAGLAPGTWLRSPENPVILSGDLELVRVAAPARQMGPLRLVGAWHLVSRDSRFGGYSGLAMQRDGRLLAASDRGTMLVFSPPGAPPAPPEFAPFAHANLTPWGLTDLESLASDPATGRLWAAYESVNRILRLEPGLAPHVFVEPPAMRRWPADSGAEAMVRLADGRFVVLAERSPHWFAATSPGLLFARDPVTSEAPVRFEFERPRGYSPTDAAQLPDGTVLIVLRDFRLGLPPRFPGLLALADPGAIRAGKNWRAGVIGALDGPVPSDNYEGVAVQPGPGDSATVWVISDDNRSPFQRTLLLEFRWSPTQKAPGSPERP